MMRHHLVIFAKEPRLGAVKSRLARDIGAVAALRFYEATLRQTVAALTPRSLRKKGRIEAAAAKTHAPWQVWLALTPDGSAQAALRRRPAVRHGVRIVAQGGGDLGARMARAFARLPPGPAVLIGSDIPGIGPHQIAEAFAALGRHDAVFGPAEDGGYWLVGQRRLAAMPGLFKNVRWSGPHALADTLANLRAGQSHALVARLADVDDGAGFRRFALRRGLIPIGSY